MPPVPPSYLIVRKSQATPELGQVTPPTTGSPSAPMSAAKARSTCPESKATFQRIAPVSPSSLMVRKSQSEKELEQENPAATTSPSGPTAPRKPSSSIPESNLTVQRTAPVAPS